MVFDRVFQKFIDNSPVSVMFRGTLENVFAPERLDAIFEQTAEKQYSRELLFSTCAELMGLVVCSIRKSVHAAYRTGVEEISVSIKSVYNKLAGIEPAVSERLVRDTAADLAAVVGELGSSLKGPWPDYDVRILDGNHLAGTDHRIGELRRLGAAALPGQAIAVLDPQLQLIDDVFLCEDGHANERILFADVLQRVQCGQCWIGDRNFCTLGFLFGLKEHRAYFVIRQHGSLHGRLVGRRRKLGRVETGVAYEQTLLIEHSDGRQMTVRRITIVRDKPTQKGDKEIPILTNLPTKVTGQTVAKAYRSRWTIETAFQDLATTLRSEINTLGYPDATLFGFCVALLMFSAFRREGGVAGSSRRQKETRTQPVDLLSGRRNIGCVARPGDRRSFRVLDRDIYQAHPKAIGKKTVVAGQTS